jgi:hypothetical protein
LEKADKGWKAREMTATNVTLSFPYAPCHEDVYGRELAIPASIRETW